MHEMSLQNILQDRTNKNNCEEKWYSVGKMTFAHIIFMLVPTLCTFCSVLHPFLLGYINLKLRDGAHKLFEFSAPFDTTYIELDHELLFKSAMYIFHLFFLLGYDVFLYLYDLTWTWLDKACFVSETLEFILFAWYFNVWNLNFIL